MITTQETGGDGRKVLVPEGYHEEWALRHLVEATLPDTLPRWKGEACRIELGEYAGGGWWRVEAFERPITPFTALDDPIATLRVAVEAPAGEHAIPTLVWESTEGETTVRYPHPPLIDGMRP